MLLQQSGLYDRAQEALSYSSKRNPCTDFVYSSNSQKQNQKELTKALRLKDMVGAFYALCSGLLLAFLAFLGECCVKRNKQQSIN